MYNSFPEKEHADFTIKKFGQFICKDAPYIAAAPDAVMAGSCCGWGLLEF